MALRVGRDPAALVGIALDRHDGGAEPRTLDADRPAARADVPDQRAEPRGEPGEGERAYLLLGHHRGAMVERVLGQRPAVRCGVARPGPAAGRRPVLAAEDEHDVGVLPGTGRGVGRCAGDDPLVRRTQALPHEQPARQAGEGRTEFRRSRARCGENRDLAVGAARVRRRTQVAAVGAHDERVVPGQTGAGERERHRGHGGHHVEVEAAGAQRPDDAEEARVARGQHHRVAAAVRRPGQGVESRTYVAHHDGRRPRRDRRGVEVPPPSDDQRRGRERLHRLRRQRRPVVPDDRDHVAAPFRDPALLAVGFTQRAAGLPVGLAEPVEVARVVEMRTRPPAARAGPTRNSVCFQSLCSLTVSSSVPTVQVTTSSSGQVAWYADDDGRVRRVAAVEQFVPQLSRSGGGQEERHRGAVPGELADLLAGRHRRLAAAEPGEDDRLGDLWNGELPVDERGDRRERARRPGRSRARGRARRRARAAPARRPTGAGSPEWMRATTRPSRRGAVVQRAHALQRELRGVDDLGVRRGRG